MGTVPGMTSPPPDAEARAPGRMVATYRVQLHPGFGFDDAAGIAGYLSDLGVSHLYASPYLQAAPGSSHGYDVVDPTKLNRELGGREGHTRMGAALEAARLGQVLDVVPNHMAIAGRDNAWWWDVLENGPSSVYAAYFDVDWDPPESKLRNTVLLPILGDHYGRVIEAGELRLAREGGGFVVHYHEHAAPIAPRSLDTLLDAATHRLPQPDADDHPENENEDERSPLPARAQLESIATAFGRLPHSWLTDRASVRERHRDKEILRARLAELCDTDPEVAKAIDADVDAVNADPDALDTLLERQNFRLAWWRTAGQELDYRRFFDISTLVGLRVEDDQVFADSHRLILEFLRDGVLDGIRIDHIDGLRDPATYLARLADAAPRAWVVVEKILEAGETLPASWPVAGTTGYDWLNLTGGLAVDPAGEQPMLDSYAEFIGEPVDFDEIVYQSKRQVMTDALAADVSRLAAQLVGICERHRRYRDYTRRDLADAVTELLASFPVYRTYAAIGSPVDEADRVHIASAVAGARARRPDLDGELLDFLQDLLLLRDQGEQEQEFALHFQQVSGPVMAKGLEDSAFYRFLPLVSHNEVGGDPSRFGVRPEEFHAVAATAHRTRPLAMLATETHDTKRSEDVRARISLLSEIPAEWAAAVGRWSTINDRHRRGDLPDRNTEWLLYQTLIGAWPIDTERIVAYMVKATREAKVHTSWVDPVADYEDAVRAFVTAIVEDSAFVADVEAWAGRLRSPGWVNSLAQKLITLTGPGVPDLYQGSELWDLSLVDPDNRRPVDFDLRRRLLAEVADAAADPAEVWAQEDGTGKAKLLVVTRALGLRQVHAEWFGAGDDGRYEPLFAEGEAAGHVVAFARAGRAITIVPRLVLGLEQRGGWGDTAITLPPGTWRNEFDPALTTTEGVVVLADLLAGFPVALLSLAPEP
jgi:(1->4)-alpha-D-glucan 1-alpha-D-glucosylmutase